MIQLEAFLCWAIIIAFISFFIGFACCLHTRTTPESRAKDRIYREKHFKFMEQQLKDLEMLNQAYDKLNNRGTTQLN